MSFSAATLAAGLQGLIQQAVKPTRFVVAFSGGLDSTVLLHALHAARAEHGTPLVAVHVDHGLHADSAAWSEHCRASAGDLGVEFHCLHVSVDTASGAGPEAAAREARYAALRRLLQPDDWLLSAHHRDDQAETLLLRLMRAGGAASLAGIRPLQRFADGYLLRPLLDVPRDELRAYAAAQALHWLEDPSNSDRRFDRNYMRHEILPRLETRWPGAAQRIHKSAALLGEASGLLSELAAIDRSRLDEREGSIALAPLRALSAARQRNIVRQMASELGLNPPGRVQLDRIRLELVDARQDAQPEVSWPGAEARRHQDRLYLMPRMAAQMGQAQLIRGVPARIELGAGLGRLYFEPAQNGLPEALFEAGLQLRYREGGEEIKPEGQVHTRKLKKLLHEEKIVPWMRGRLPLLFSGERLVAVADLWIAAEDSHSPGLAVRWQGRPALR